MATLENFNLITIRIGDEKEAGNDFAIGGEVYQLARGEARSTHTCMFGIDIIDRNRKMTIAITSIIRLGAILVDRQFQLEAGFGI